MKLSFTAKHRVVRFNVRAPTPRLRFERNTRAGLEITVPDTTTIYDLQGGDGMQLA
jgi:hypothetical protein